MCTGCWASVDYAWSDTPAARAMVERFKDADEYGALHIVTGDWNLEDGHLRWSMEQADATEDEKRLMQDMLALTHAERWTVALLSENGPDFDPVATRAWMEAQA